MLKRWLLPVIASAAKQPSASWRRLLAASACCLTLASPAPAQTYPVDVVNCFETIRFEEAPRRALVHDANMVQTILDLGLADRIVGVSGIGGVERHLVAPRAIVARLPQFLDRSPSMEAMLGQNPDFIFAGWNYGFDVARGVTPAMLAEMGVKTYTLRESCIRIGRREPISMATLYVDLAALGAIFGIRERADAMIAGLKVRVAAVEERVRGAPRRPRIMYCDDCGAIRNGSSSATTRSHWSRRSGI